MLIGLYICSLSIATTETLTPDSADTMGLTMVTVMCRAPITYQVLYTFNPPLNLMIKGPQSLFTIPKYSENPNVFS